MAEINSLVISGRLTRDAVITYTSSGMAISKFSIANNRRVKKDNNFIDIPNYFDCTLFGAYAESINKYLTKGTSLVVQGELRYESWEDKNSGEKKSKLSIIVSNLQLFGQNMNRNKEESSKKEERDKIEEIEFDSSSFDEDIPF